MDLPKYPLEELATIKRKKLDEAERILREKKEALNHEIEKLRKVEKIRDTAHDHKRAKLKQLREELDKGTTSVKIQRMKQYLTVVDEDLKLKTDKVEEQKKEVAKAKNQLEEARRVFFQRQKDVEKLKLHRKEWEKEMKGILSQKEALVTDEVGSSMYIIKKQRQLPLISFKEKKKERKNNHHG